MSYTAEKLRILKIICAGADIFLDPVETGGGIQSKIVEALSYDLNVVCFQGQADEPFTKAGEKILHVPKGILMEWL
jgi:hypothetical protein